MLSFEEAIGNAKRLLEQAELEPDLARMELAAALADSWTTLAVVVSERERA